MSAVAAPEACWVDTHDAQRAWVAQRPWKRGQGVHHGAFMRAARKAGVRHSAGSRIWSGYQWHADDLARLMNVNVPAEHRRERFGA